MTERMHSFRPELPQRSLPSVVLGGLRLVFFGQIRLHRRAGRLRLSWGANLRTGAQSSALPSGGRFEGCLRTLREALNAQPAHRPVLRHLVHLEAACSRRGREALEDTPLTVLRRAHEQLRMLAQSLVSDDLTLLATRVEQAIVRRGGAAEPRLPSAGPAARAIEVVEGRLSDFLQLTGQVEPKVFHP